MKNPRNLEKEFGVAIPGAIVEPALWTQTALKKLPPEGPLDFAQLFGRTAPLIVDVGCGNGRYLLGSCLFRPDFDHLGIDILPMVLRYATRRGNQRGLANLRFAALDGQRLVQHYTPADAVREIHCYHPQPFHAPHDAHKRLISPIFLAHVHRALENAGLFFVQTDNPPYWDYLRTIVPTFFDFHEQLRPWPDAPKGRTRREILALKRGYTVQRGWGTVRKDLASDEAFRLATALPLPTFDAGPRLRDLDEMEAM